MRATPTVLAVTTTLSLACADQGPIHFLVGTYALQTVDGSPLPYLSSQHVYLDTVYGLPVDVVESDELIADTLRIAELTYDQISILQLTELLTELATGETMDSNVTARSVTHTGRWGELTIGGGDTIVSFRVDPAGDVWSASAANGVLTLLRSDVAYVYERER